MAWEEITVKFLEVMGTGAIGFGTGYFAKKRAAQTEVVTDLQLIKDEAAESFKLLKAEYVALADYMREELRLCRIEHVEAKAEKALLKAEMAMMSNKISELTNAMHNIIQTPKQIKK